MRKFHLDIVTPDGISFSDEAESVLLRCEMGDIMIMAGHEDFFATLGVGRACVNCDGTSRDASLAGGFVSVKNGEVKVICTTFEFKEDIDLKRAETAKERAESTIRNSSDDKVILVAKAKLKRALNRINVANLK